MRIITSLLVNLDRGEMFTIYDNSKRKYVADCVISVSPNYRYLNERRLNGDGNNTQKRNATEAPLDGQTASGKRPRGRPKGSKNRTKGGAAAS